MNAHICIQCKNCIITSHPEMGLNEFLCNRRYTISPVTGYKYYGTHCDTEREHGECGPRGIFFEQREQWYKRFINFFKNMNK